MATELTLGAALRDSGHPHPDTRNVGVRNLAPALLESLGATSPAWDAARDRAKDREQHDSIDQVIDALDAAVDDGAPQIRGLAMVGLGQLGLARVVPLAATLLDPQHGSGAEDDPRDRDHAEIFIRECAVIATSLVGAAASRTLAEDPDHPEAPRVLDDARALLERALVDLRVDVRFQAAPALAEFGARRDEGSLVEAFLREDDDDVRENLVRALATYDPPGPRACEALAEVVRADERRPSALSYEAALALAGARRPEGGPRLIEALSEPRHRDRALEALAALGPRAPDSATILVRRMANGWLTPSVTRVRAAYALARMAPHEGMALLQRLEHNIRPAVREGVRDAREALRRLEVLDEQDHPS